MLYIVLILTILTTQACSGQGDRLWGGGLSCS